MRFTLQQQRWFEAPAGTVSEAFLLRDAWNDYGYVTMFDLVIYDDDGVRRDIGQVKIARTGMGNGGPTSTSDILPDSFEKLDDSHFSLGQDDTYYERLGELGDGLREVVLRSLQDIAFAPSALERARGEAVTETSFYRFVSESVVTGWYRRIAQGGERLTEYRFTYVPGPEATPLLFDIEPDGRPPTNIHVLIGRNNVGKSFLLRNLVRAAVEGRDMAPEAGTIIYRAGTQATFLGVVAVSFSAFDEYVDIPPERQLIPCTYIGVRAPLRSGTDHATLRSRADLATQFAASLDACLTGRAAARWIRAVETLRYSGSGFLEDDSWIEMFRRAEPDRRHAMATELFGNLSSGHAIVLLTVTSLVEHVTERALVVLDEPESHLHPPLLAAFVRALSGLLMDRNGVAVVATHSPVVLQEVPASCVYKLRRYGSVLEADRPTMETFGENVGTLTHEVFSLEVTDSGYHRDLRDAVREGLSFEEVLARFDNKLGAEARTIARTLVAVRDSAGQI
ncbi:AAA family ATPase [Symbioplanes lichenis]|uniref:AAA family ATPase n=1 Tax=Symbioplanes lichenis TaxID=1629072 RepID=UPI0027382D23|nr:AAA family ATPase [Actinoplanes lichenis]